MRYVTYLMIMISLLACGNQDYQQARKSVHLLNEKPTVPREKNESVAEKLKPVVAVSKIETSEDSFKLAEIEIKMKEEILALKIQHEQSLKKMDMEANSAKASQEKELALAKLANEKELSGIALANKQQIEMEKIKSQKEISQAEEKTMSEKVSNEKELALATLKNTAVMDAKQLEFYKMIAMIITGLIVLGLLMVYFIVQRKRKNELKLQENELRHKEYLEASKQHNEHVKKMLEIITDESMDKGIKKEMMGLLKDQSSQANLIEHKK